MSEMQDFLESRDIRRELKLQLHFVVLMIITAYGWYGLVLVQGDGTSEIMDLYHRFFLNWLVPFLILGAIRVSIIPFQHRNQPAETTAWSIKNEFVNSMVYSFFGTLSVYLSFVLLLFKFDPQISININELWLSLRPMFYAWIISFNLLIAMRFGLILLNKYRQKKIARKF